MSNKAINWAYAQAGIKGGPKFVLVTLADMADQEHSCYPGMDALAELTGYGVTAIRGHIDRLVELGLIITERRHKRNGARTSDRYYLQLDDPKTVTPDTEGTQAEPNAGKRANLTPDFEAPNAGFRGAYKDEPTEEPKGEPTDIPPTPKPTDLLVVEAFDEFWGIYPRREAKKVAAAKFAKALTKAPASVIIAGARRYADFCAAVNRSPEHIAHPSSWLNGERWHDELHIPGTPPPASVRQRAAEVDAELQRREQARLELGAVGA